MSRVLVCGDRNWTDKELIAGMLAKLTNVEEVIEGKARGADSLAGEVAREMGIPVREFPAQWETYGRRAGPIRNLQMLNEGKPDVVIAFHDTLWRSRGTKHMIKIAEKAEITVMIISHQAPEQ